MSPRDEGNDHPEAPDESSGEYTGPERRDPRRRRRSRTVGRVLGLLSLGVALTLFQFTQTSTGRNAAIALLQRALDNAVDGEVRIGPVLGGNLITRIVLSSFEIVDNEGMTFVAMDTVALEYDPLLLLRRQIRIRRLDAAYAEIRVAVDTDGRWNFERILAGAEADTSEVADSLMVAPLEENDPFRFILGDATIRDGLLEIRVPWTEGLEGRERDRAFAAARDPASIWYDEETEDGEFERVYRIDGLAGQFPLLRLIDPPRPFHIAMENVSGRLSMVAAPLDVQRFSGDVTFGDTIRVGIDRFETAGSSIAGSGHLTPGEPLEFHFDLHADRMVFEDMAWLPIPIPVTGGGVMDLSLSSRGETTIVAVSNAAIVSENTRVEGGFTMAVESTPRFESLDLTLKPMHLSWLDDLLERETVIDGHVTGTIHASGRIDDLTIAADLTLADVDGGVGSPSVLSVVGGVGIVDPFPVRDLELTLRAFEPRWARIIGLDTTIPGRIGGSVRVGRPGDGIFAFSGDLSYLGSDGDVSSISGAGTVDLAEGSIVDIAIEAAPLALSALRPWVPDVDLVGSVSGPVQARGDLGNLLVEADLITPRGRLKLEGRFGFESESPTYDATLEASDIAIDQWIENAPSSRLALRGRVTGSGIDPETLSATFDLEILPSEFERADLEASFLRFHVEDGLATIDTLILRADVGAIAGRGEFGLTADRVGTLEFEAEATDLSEWNRWVAEDIPGGRAATGDEIFASFAAATAEPGPDETVEGLLGSARARGVVVGTLGDFAIEGSVEAGDVRFARWGADTLSVRIQLDDPPTTADFGGHLTATGVLVDGVQLDSVDLDVERRDAGPFVVTVYSRRDSTVEASGSGEIRLEEGNVLVALESARVRLGNVESTLLDPARVVYTDSLLRFDDLVVAGSLGRFEADGSIGAGTAGNLAVRLAGLRIAELGYLWSDRPEVGGTMSGSAALSGTLDAPVFQGEIRLLDPSVRDHRYSSLDVRFDYSRQRFVGSLDLTRDGNRLARLEGTVETDLRFGTVDRRLLPDPLDLRVDADSLPLQLLELMVKGLRDVGGVAFGSVTLEGEPGELRYGGSLAFQEGEAWVPDLGIRMIGVNGEVTFRGREARLDSIVLASEAGGSATVAGTLDLSSLLDPMFDLDLQAVRLQAISRRDIELAVDGAGHLGGRYSAPEVTGQFRLRDGTVRQDEFLRERQILDLSDPTFYGLLDSASVRDAYLLDRFRNPFMDNLRLDIELALGPNLWLRSPTLDVEMVSEGLLVRLDQATSDVRVTGGVDLARGTYRFDRIPPYVQALRITEGTIQFVGSEDFNPNLDISAEYRNRTKDGPVLIQVGIGGTLLSTNLQISSTPPMSDTDELCFLAVGAPCVGSGDAQLGQRLVQETLLGTLSSGLSSALVGSTGLSYFNLTSIAGTTPRGGLRSDNLFDQTAVEFGWYASEQVFFTFQQPLRGGLPRATIEWRFNPVWSLEAKASSRFDDRLFGLDHTSFQDQQTFGLFLFREWSY
ncbi:MAG: translocation/assembly module TamB domain-containing protein [Gemmatimonadota bacterium]